MNRTREEWKRLDLGNAPDLFTAEDYNGQTYWIMAHAKADIEELHEENARLRAQVAELVKAGKYAPTYLDWLIKLMRDDNEHSERIRIVETLAANLRAAIAAAESEAANG